MGGFYSVINSISNPTAFTVQIQSLAGGQIVGLPPAQFQDILSDGTNIKLRNLPPIGTYWDFIGTSIPNWVTACTVPPYLYCNGGSFSAVTYPYLNTLLGGTVLPDMRGRAKASFNDGTGRITSGTGGIDGNTIGAAGGVQTVTLSSQNVPPVPYTDPGHVHFVQGTGGGGGTSGLQGNDGGGAIGGSNTNTASIGITIGNASPSAFSILPPMAVSGITMIRAG
jgi:microcystin-dependent protein